MQRLFTRSAQVQDLEDVGAAFRIVTLGGDALRGVDWTPGDKVQIQLGGWVQRTYTPLDWDAAAGRARLLVHLQGDGPGTQWARNLRAGDACVVFGPRKSIDLTRCAASALLFGDETSFGLAAALLRAVRPPSVHLLFEVSSLALVQPALAHLGLGGAELGVRAANDAHLATLEEQLLARVRGQATTSVVLTGHAGSIQRLRKRLRQARVEPSRLQVKAYWATGKTGLD